MASTGHIGAKSSSSDAVIQTLKWARKQGFKPVALHKQSKASIDDKYVSTEYTPPSDDLWLQRDLGIGIVTGPRHSGPVDVDLDCAEAVYFAGIFLPPTPAVFGRESKRRSHYLYTVDAEECVKKAFNDPLVKPGQGGATMVEIRGDGGHQTVFPGSVHELSGELVEWDSVTFPDVPRVVFEDLDKAVKKVAIATMIARHLWAEGQRNEVCKHLAGMFYYLEWTEDEVKAMFSAVMSYMGDEDRTRLRTVTSTFRKGADGGKITGSNTLKEFLGEARVVDRILEWAGSEQAGLLQEYNERFAVVSVEGKFRVAETTPIKRGEPPVLYAKDDFLNFMSTDTAIVEGEKGPKRVPKAILWLASPRRRSYRTMDFIPGDEDTGAVLNLWTGWGIAPSSQKVCSAWLDLLFYVICGQDEGTYNWMLHWFANIVREPCSKPMTAPVMIGKQGAGKSLLLRYFGEILGSAYVTVTNEEHIYGRFNKHLATTLLLHSEEALYGGDRKHRGIIKSLITDEFRIFEQKGVDARRVHNYLRLALTSNEAHAAPTEAGDRRFTVLDLQGRKIDENRIRQVLAELKDGGPAALFHYLQDMKYDPVIPRTNIKNEALATMKQINFEPVVAWWYQALQDGQVLPDCLAWATKPDRAEWPQVVSTAAMHAAFVIRMKERGARFVLDNTSFAMMLNKMVGRKLNKQQKYFNNPLSNEAPREVRMLSNKQYAVTDMPSLEDCRAAFDEFVGQRMKWPAAPPKEEMPAHVVEY